MEKNTLKKKRTEKEKNQLNLELRAETEKNMESAKILAAAKKKDEPPLIKHTLLEEIWAIFFALLAIFVFIAIQMPNSTGILGRWLIENVAKMMVGRTIRFLPLFFLGYSITYLFFDGKKRWKITLPSFTIAYISFAILIQLYIYGPLDEITWPVSTTGGGLVGTLGLFTLQKVLGIYGAILAIIGLLSVSTLLFFNFSIGNFLKQFKTINKDLEFELNADAYKGLRYRMGLFLNKFLFKNQQQQEVMEAPQVNHNLEYQEESSSQPDFIPLRPAQPARQKTKPTTTEFLHAPTDSDFSLPSINLLDKGNPISAAPKGKEQLLEQSRLASVLEETLLSFGVEASVVNITPGPSVTRFELRPGHGVKISKITALSKDIALKLAAADVRIEAPIPGKSLIGIEVPNLKTETVTLRNIFEKTEFSTIASKLVCAMGLTISGEAIVMDLAKMPHVLIAGATGSGKSVCINAIILSILLRATPEEVKFLMIDPKKVELSLYEGIPHLLAPVVTDPNRAAATLKRWALAEMERRYEVFSKIGTKNLEGYNEKIEELQNLYKLDPERAKAKVAESFLAENEMVPMDEINVPPKLPYIVVIIDELADLMMVASQDVEHTICRLAQMARATGIHLVVATQRPSVNVVTGLIKANIPSRISFFLQSQIDSRTILDMPGAEKLLGKGDMLYCPVGSFKPLRLQGVYISEKEVKTVVDFLKKQGGPNYLTEILNVELLEESNSKTAAQDDNTDSLFDEAKNIVLSTQYASTSYLQRKLRIGYNRAARLMDELEEKGVINRTEGDKKARTVIPSMHHQD